MAIADTPSSDSIQARQREAEIIARKQERLHILRKQQAACGINTAPQIEMEIAQLEQELEALASIHLQQKRDLQTEQLCSPISQYDEFFRLLFGESVRWEGEKKYFHQRLLNNLIYACNADGALITRFNGIDWEITESSYGSEHKSKDEFLQQLLSRTLTLANEPLYRNPFTLNNTLKGVHPNGKIYTCTIFPNSTPYKALIIYGIRNPLQLDITYITIINTLLSATANITTARGVEELETTVYNALKHQFQYVSDYVYHRQFELFTNRLRRMIVYFEPIISLSRKPYISRWEALARDPATEPMCAPAELFSIAELWGRMFQLELDKHFLQTAIASYYSSNKKSSPAIARGELPALSVNIYPESLVRRSFQKIIAQIEEERIFPLDKLVLEISEKLPLPTPEKADGTSDPIGWFREKLRFFTDLGISFAIDDFGVGYASTSRLSRLEPEFVKVDRDALLHQLGGFTLEYARNLVSGSLGKMKMIVEGFDDQSRFTLAQLYDLKIRYVQGHLLGRAQEQIYQLSPEDEVRIAALLQR